MCHFSAIWRAGDNQYLATGESLGLISNRIGGWDQKHVNTCGDGGASSCVVSSIPLIVGLLMLVVIALLAYRFYLSRTEQAPPSPNPEPGPKPAGKPDAKPATKPAAPSPAPKPAPPPEPKAPPKPTPLQVKFTDPPDLKLSHFKGDTRIQNDFADLMTSTILSSQGWKQLPSRYHRDRGIGGLFLREVRGGGGYECLAVESASNGTNYDPASMADTKLAAEIAQLYELGAFPKQTADELMRGLHQGASFFRKELWRHDLSSGLTTISELGRKGEKGRSLTRSNARLMAALYLALTSFDRDAVYLGQAPLEGE